VAQCKDKENGSTLFFTIISSLFLQAHLFVINRRRYLEDAFFSSYDSDTTKQHSTMFSAALQDSS
jgi:hypothetical protein